ncbi:hypothetical protein NECAME_08490 [Necator americanus]|uniref:Uncharacterized protein n=1 Tax=Necator americanus TaxID=51031 RepID=W2TJR5_NECAM|nr:hypothetical protein NECAME_08490 [Necator americanus]ETN81416.1 hypothetical protein NECAME_08490 [Necator americanus]
MGGFPRVSSLITYSLEAWEYFVTFTMILAFLRESPMMMLPFIGQMFLVVVMMLIMFFQLLFCVFVPYSSIAEQFFSDGRYTFVQREKKLFFVLIIVAFFTFISGWFLKIALATYQYFDYMAMKKARKSGRSAHEQLPALVQQDALPPPPSSPSQSFPNPNFNGNSDDEDEVFEKSQTPAANIV